MSWFRKQQPETPLPSYLRPIEGSEGYSFCESVTATGLSRWHVRELCPKGRKLGGGITTRSLCGHVKPLPEGCGGWDLKVSITEYHLGHSCPECAEELRRRLSAT